VPAVVESLAALSEEAPAFFRNLGHWITTVTAEPKLFQFLMLHLSIAVQRGNAALPRVC